MRQVRTTMFRGKQTPLSEVAEALGVPYIQVWQRTVLNRETGDDIERNVGRKKPGTRKGKLFEYDGLSMTVSEWAKTLHVSENAIRARIKKHGSPYSPRTVNIREIAEKHGISRGTLYARLKRGEPLETAAGPYRRKRNRAVIEVNGVLRNRNDVMREAGVSRQLLSMRLASGWTLEEAASTPPRSNLRDALARANLHTVNKKGDKVVFTPDPNKEYTKQELLAIVYSMKNAD